MLEQLNFSLGDKSHGSEQAQLLEDYLKQNQRDFGAALIPDLSYLDPRALPVDGIQVKKVEHIQENQYRLLYSFDWAAFGGCVGLDESGTDQNKVNFKLLDDGKFVFDLTALGRD